MVVQAIAGNLDLDCVFRAMALERRSAETGLALMDAAVDGGMNGNLGQINLPVVQGRALADPYAKLTPIVPRSTCHLPLGPIQGAC